MSPQSNQSIVSVEDIPPQFPHSRVLSLFDTAIGNIHASRSLPEKDALEIVFSSNAIAQKAIDLNGYSLVAGHRLTVKLLPEDGSREATDMELDPRRNLYVLGLPFALTKSEFTATFSKYGRVLHCVILATVDNSSRRRGFVVMASHAEAKKAMDALSNKPMKGGQALDISWAVVQRSQGFLDGGDREVFQDSAVPPAEAQPDSAPSSSSSSSAVSDSETSPTPLISCRVPTSILLLKNLPKLLFSSSADLQPLLYPYGQVNQLEIIPHSLKGTLPSSVTVIVEYAGLKGALQALEGLQGQCYDNHKLSLEFLKPSVSRTAFSSTFHNGYNSKPKVLTVINSHKTDFRNNASACNQSPHINENSNAMAVNKKTKYSPLAATSPTILPRSYYSSCYPRASTNLTHMHPHAFSPLNMTLVPAVPYHSSTHGQMIPPVFYA